MAGLSESSAETARRWLELKAGFFTFHLHELAISA
jgi:hypothetical protein